MKTVKIILKFKFLTLFSDKIIQCYTESTVYTIITLFLYGIGAFTPFLFCFFLSTNYIIPIWNWSLNKQFLCNFSCVYYIIPIWNWSSLTLNLRLISCSHYIIPIWNWSNVISEIPFEEYFITLFLYGIGASCLCFKSKPRIITLFLYGIGAIFTSIFIFDKNTYF